jgi:hypothetical protein
MLYCCAVTILGGVLLGALVLLPGRQAYNTAQPQPRWQAEVKTLAAAIRYLLEPEQVGHPVVASNRLLPRPVLDKISNSVALTDPSNHMDLPSKTATNTSTRS